MLRRPNRRRRICSLTLEPALIARVDALSPVRGRSRTVEGLLNRALDSMSSRSPIPTSGATMTQPRSPRPSTAPMAGTSAEPTTEPSPDWRRGYAQAVRDGLVPTPAPGQPCDPRAVGPCIDDEDGAVGGDQEIGDYRSR